MEFLSKKQKIIFITIGTLMVIFIGCYIIKKQENYSYSEIELETIENDIEDSVNKEEKIEDTNIIVHITGEIINDGIIEIEEGSRIADVIEEAGGITEEADLSKVNLAYQVSDGQKIYIPNVNEKEDESQTSSEEYITNEAGNNIIIEGKEVSSEKVNINTAMQTELETLNGIGPSTALKIINYRNENGKFETIEDIKNVPGIGEQKFENIKEDICV